MQQLASFLHSFLYRLLYSVLWYLLLPVLLLRLWWRGRLAPAYRQRWRERLALGYRRNRLPQCVWIHAVSVGETLAAAAMIRALQQRYPHMPIVVTTTTPTGSEQVRSLFADALLSDKLTHVYCPWDTPDALARFFRAFSPRLIIIMETELWPNLVAAAARRQVPVVLANGRLSASSQRGYGRFRPLITPMLAALSKLFVQTEQEAERFRQLGASTDAVAVTGNIKFDVELSEPLRAAATSLKTTFASRPVWIAASTHPGEDEPVLRAHRQLLERFPNALLILVPRHPERFQRLAEQISQDGFSIARRSLAQKADKAQVYLADTMGELLMLFGCADVAFVGGSLEPIGGHNLLEPAAWKIPVLSGPHLKNFAAISQWLEQAGGLLTVHSADTLAQAVAELFADPARRATIGRAAASVVDQHRGALQRLLNGVDDSWPLS